MNWKRIWITGAGKGIGAALVEAFSRYPVTLIISARSESDLTALQTKYAKSPANIEIAPMDICDEATVSEALTSWEAKGQLPDLAILNAGTHVPISADDFSLDKARFLLETNLNGTLHCMAPLLKYFQLQRRGHIAVVASVAGYRGLPTSAIYGASKAALIHMCEALYPELKAVNVKLQVINPGFVRTPLTDKNEFAMPALMEPEDAAQAIIKGLESNRFEISFPRRFVLLLKLLRILPYPWYFSLTRKLIQ